MSLRARVLVGMAFVAIVLAVAAVAVAQTTETHLLHQVDARLRNAAGPVHGTDFGDGDGGGDGGPGGPQDNEPMPLSSVYVGVVNSDGTVTDLVTPSLEGDEPPRPSIDGAEAIAKAGTHDAFTVGSEGGDLRYRVMADTDERSGEVVVVALPLNDVDAAVDRLVTVEVVATAVILGVLGLVAWWVIHLGVRPIKRMTVTATAIAGGDLSHRVPDVAPGTEAGELGVALNQMLGRIEEAFDQRTQSEARLRQFVADASHELRTPVTTIRGYAELYRAGGLDQPDELQEAMRRTEQEAVRMGTLVDDLLHLARLDQGQPMRREAVDLGAVAEDAVRDAKAVDPERSITAVVDGPAPVTITGDDSRLRQVVANLVGNALVHTEPGTPIEVRVCRQGDRAVVEVADQGAGMTDDVAGRAFERFFRADPSRSRHRGGSGLGLAIVAATVSAHGGEVALQTAPGSGTTVRVLLPA